MKLKLTASTLVIVVLFNLGCSIDATIPTERIETEIDYNFGPVTHQVVCYCTCQSDNTSDKNREVHAYPSGGGCKALNTTQCTVKANGGFGKLEECFEKSVQIDDE